MGLFVVQCNCGDPAQGTFQQSCGSPATKVISIRGDFARRKMSPLLAGIEKITPL
jgi:hypothetical protein